MNNEDNITYQPPKKTERIAQFKRFLFSKLRERWLLMPKAQAALEKNFVLEFLQSI